MSSILNCLLSHKKLSLGVGLLLVLAIVITVLLATLLPSANPRKELIEDLFGAIDRDRIRDNLRFLSSEPHMAGTPRDTVLANWVKKRWREAGLEDVREEPYDVLLSFPDRERPNKAIIMR